MPRRRKLRPVPSRLPLMLNLRRNRSRTRIVHHRCLLWRRPGADPAPSAVITHPAVIPPRRRIVINVVNHSGIHIGDVAIIIQAAIAPVRPVVTAPRISKSIIDAAIKTDMRTPVPGVPQIISVVVIPVRRRPQCIHPRRQHPRARHPVIAAICVTPVARRPVIAVPGDRRLRVFRQRRRRFRRLHRRPVRYGIVARIRRITLVVGRHVINRIALVRGIRIIGGRLNRRSGLIYRSQISSRRIRIGNNSAARCLRLSGRRICCLVAGGKPAK